MTDNELNYRIAKEREDFYRRELVQLAGESVQRDGALAKLEAEVIASREIVRKAVARAEDLERHLQQAKSDHEAEFTRAQAALDQRDHWRDRARGRAYREAFNASDGITESMAAKAKRVALFAAVLEK